LRYGLVAANTCSHDAVCGGALQASTGGRAGSPAETVEVRPGSCVASEALSTVDPARAANARSRTSRDVTFIGDSLRAEKQNLDVEFNSIVRI
jgi:hypothetical protein